MLTPIKYPLSLPSSYPLDEVDKITFTENGIQLHNVGGITKIAFPDFLLFTFSEIEHPYLTDIEPVSSPQEVSVSYVAGSGSLLVSANQPLDVVLVYDMQGRIVAQSSSPSSSFSLSIGSAPKGVYIIKIGSGVKSIVKKIAL